MKVTSVHLLLLISIFSHEAKLGLAETSISVKIPVYRSVRFVDETHGWIAGYQSVFYTSDRGKTWQKQLIGTSSVNGSEKPSLYDLGSIAWADSYSAFVANERGWVVGDMRSNEWRQVTIPEDLAGAMETIAFADRWHGWGVGNTGEIFWTHDGGTSWHRSSVLRTLEPLTTVFVKSAKEVWAGGARGTLIYTRNGGQSWRGQDLIEDSNIDIKCIRFFNGGRGWICGMGSLAFKTNDGGRRWSKTTLPAARLPFWRSVSFANEEEGWIVGSRDIKGDAQGAILHTTDSGLHWETQDYNSKEPLVDIQALPCGEAWAIGENGNVLHTIDHGNTWIAVRLE